MNMQRGQRIRIRKDFPEISAQIGAKARVVRKSEDGTKYAVVWEKGDPLVNGQCDGEYDTALFEPDNSDAANNS